ncbi:hypothetical protein EPN15_00850 [Patescibacteria group bacterium]|nr:MAG: hypothetical protein EPN15_00850 [Patescibacteria group bacterium]
MQSNPESEQSMEEELESRFVKKGGRVLKIKENGAPQRWLCAIDDNGEPFDPPGIDPKNVIREINGEGKCEGVNPSEEDIEEIKQWRSDWNNQDPKGKS